MDDNNFEGWARTVTGEFSKEAVVQRAELDALHALKPGEASMIPPTVFKRMLDRIMRVKTDGLIKAAQYNGLEATVKKLLSLSERRVSVTIDGFEGKEISIKFENACVLSCIFCQKKTPPSIPSGCGCKGTVADVQLVPDPKIME